MRHRMPHQENIGVDPYSCKSFLRPIRRFRLESIKAEMELKPNFGSCLRLSPTKTITYLDCWPAGESQAAAARDIRYATEA